MCSTEVHAAIVIMSIIPSATGPLKIWKATPAVKGDVAGTAVSESTTLTLGSLPNSAAAKDGRDVRGRVAAAGIWGRAADTIDIRGGLRRPYTQVTPCRSHRKQKHGWSVLTR